MSCLNDIASPVVYSATEFLAHEASQDPMHLNGIIATTKEMPSRKTSVLLATVYIQSGVIQYFAIGERLGGFAPRLVGEPGDEGSVQCFCDEFFISLQPFRCKLTVTLITPPNERAKAL